MSSRRVSDALGIPIKQVHRLAERGELPPAQKLEGPRGAYLFEPTTVIAYGTLVALEAEKRVDHIREALAELEELAS